MTKDKDKGIMVNEFRNPRVKQKGVLPWVDANIYHGGYFDFVNKKVEYVGGELYVKLTVDVSAMDLNGLRREIGVVFEHVYSRTFENFSIWFCTKGMNLTKGRKQIVNDDDVRELLDTVNDYNRINIWVIVEKDIVTPHERRYRCKNFHFPTAAQLGYTEGKDKVVKVKTEPSTKPKKPALQSPMSRSPRINPDVVLTGPNWTDIPTQVPDTEKEHEVGQNLTENQHLNQTNPHPNTSNSQPISPHLNIPTSPSLPPISPTTQKAILQAENPRAKFYKPPKKSVKQAQQPQKLVSSKRKLFQSSTSPLRKTPLRVKHVARKPKPLTPKVAKKKKVSKKKGVAKGDEKDGEWGESDNCGEGEWSDSSGQDTDVDFVPEEEEFGDLDNRKDELKAARLRSASNEPVKVGRDSNQAEEGQGVTTEEVYYDSDELRSLDGSDEEQDNYTTFNPDVDFKKNIVLTQGLKFKDVTVLRKALQRHSVENHYVYYLLHSEKNKLTAYCRHRCDCEWDSKHGIIRNCSCKGKFKCNFRVFASKMKGSTDLQIKTCNLDHQCGYQDVNHRVTSQYLADRYLDLFRADPSLGLKSFITIVQRDVGTKINYYKAWYARARAKLMLYGDASDEYARVYDYGQAILKHNPGSTVCITTEGAEVGKPVFQRMYVCFKACKDGFRAGCRPLLGVDGCHLKGAYPGMILVAVAKDGNNCIYPVAWAVVEVENTDSWIWFLSLLVEDIGMAEGEGLTIMSDRQKGLVDAIGVCLPKAEVRYCVRHIWANFKLQFSGASFKEYFWHAARTSNVNVFNAQMEIIRLLDEEAYEWLAAIPKQHWARHEFQTFSKSNMLLNNLCETFNGVLREARDKPIITCLEWIRRYVMRRNFEKLQSLEKLRTNFMPYVSQVLKWVHEESRNCYPTQCSEVEWEVSHNGDNLVVNLHDWTCDCKKWVMTGIPCPHAFACIMRRRENPENYVHQFYSKEKYCEAYKQNVRAMPGHKHWEVQDTEKPEPPVMRRMPGRPSKKKRKKEVGEDGEVRFVKRMRRQNVCSNCGTPGHNRTKCQNVCQPPKPKSKGGRPYSEDVWVKNQRKKKEAKAIALQAALRSSAPSTSKVNTTGGPKASASTQASQNSIVASNNPIPSKPPLPKHQTRQQTTSQPPFKPPGVTIREVGQSSRVKMPVKPKKKKMLVDLSG